MRQLLFSALTPLSAFRLILVERITPKERPCLPLGGSRPKDTKHIFCITRFAPYYILYNNYCFFRNLFVGYLGAIVYNLRRENKAERFPLPWLLAIGVLVQFGWEAGLLLGGIRSAGFSAEARLLPLIVNSLLETNLGMPYIYAIYIAYSRRFTEQLRPREKVLSFRARVAENNGQLNPLKLSRM